MAYVPFTEQMRAVVIGRNAEQWQAAINQQASGKGMEPLPPETIEALRVSLLIGVECAGLGEVSTTPPRHECQGLLRRI
jgi:hypothetical protein